MHTAQGILCKQSAESVWMKKVNEVIQLWVPIMQQQSSDMQKRDSYNGRFQYKSSWL